MQKPHAIGERTSPRLARACCCSLWSRAPSCLRENRAHLRITKSTTMFRLGTCTCSFYIITVFLTLDAHWVTLKTGERRYFLESILIQDNLNEVATYIRYPPKLSDRCLGTKTKLRPPRHYPRSPLHVSNTKT